MIITHGCSYMAAYWGQVHENKNWCLWNYFSTTNFSAWKIFLMACCLKLWATCLNLFFSTMAATWHRRDTNAYSAKPDPLIYILWARDISIITSHIFFCGARLRRRQRNVRVAGLGTISASFARTWLRQDTARAIWSHFIENVKNFDQKYKLISLTSTWWLERHHTKMTQYAP